MSFKRTKKENSELVVYGLSKEETDEMGLDNSLFKQDQEQLVKVFDRNPDSREKYEAEARIDAIRTMNAMRTIAPIIAVACEFEGNDKEQSEKFVELMQESNRLAQLAVIKIGIPESEWENKENRWLFNTLERVFAETVAKSKNPQEIGERMVNAVLKWSSDNTIEKRPSPSESYPARFEISVLKALSRIVQEQEKFNFLRKDKDADLSLILNKIIQSVSDWLPELFKPLMVPEDRFSLMEVWIEESGKAFASAWSAEAKLAQEAMKNRTKEQIEAFKKARPEGIDLQGVFKRHDEIMMRLLKIVKLPRKTVNKR